MSLPRFLRNAFKGYDVIDVKEILKDGRIEIYLDRLTHLRCS